MKTINLMKPLTVTLLLTSLLAGPFTLPAAESKGGKKKPYPLDTCVVSDEKIGANPDMKPYVFTHEDREIKLCCKGCLKDFNKDKAKYLKKIETAEKRK